MDGSAISVGLCSQDKLVEERSRKKRFDSDKYWGIYKREKTRFPWSIEQNNFTKVLDNTID